MNSKKVFYPTKIPNVSKVTKEQQKYIEDMYNIQLAIFHIQIRMLI